jgi:hypothetical protein
MDRLVHLGVRIIEIVFFTGLAGSAIVVAWSFVEDMFQIFEKDQPSESSHSSATSTTGPSHHFPHDFHSPASGQSRAG